MAAVDIIGWGALGLIALLPLTILTHIHSPALGQWARTTLPRLATVIDTVNTALGHAAAGATAVMVLLQFSVVLMRYVFGVNFIQLQELMIYLHATVFMAAAAYALRVDEHVRVDIFYRGASERGKAVINLFGVYLLLMPFAAIVWVSGYPFVASSWAILEGSQETSGIQAVFLLKTLILIFAAGLFLQGWSLAVRSLLVLTGDEEAHHAA